MIFQRPLHEVAAWPAADVALLNAYIAHRPPASERIEAMLARFMAVWVGSKQQPGTEPPKPSEYLTYRAPWPEPEPAAAPSVYAEQRRASIQNLKALSARFRR